MRKRTTIGSPKAPLSRRLSALIEKALRPRKSPEVWTRPMAVKDLAVEIGVGYQSLAYYLSARNNVPAFILPAVCKALNNYEPLNLLESKVGRVAYHVPDLSGFNLAKDDLNAVQKLVREVGEALEALGETLRDGIVEEEELERTIPQLHDVIRECVRLEHWLKKRCATDRAGSVVRARLA